MRALRDVMPPCTEMTTRFRVVVLAGILWSLCPTLASASAPVQCLPAYDKLRLQLSWVNSPEFAGFVAPNSGVTGIPTYSQENLCVQIREGGPAFDPLTELKDGRVDMALAEGAYVAQQIGAGNDYTIIASFYQSSSLALVGLASSQSLRDLALYDTQRRVGFTSQGYDLMVKLMLNKSNVELTTVTQVNQRMGPAGLSGLQDGTIDVATATVYRDLGEVLQWLNPKTKFLYQQEDVSLYTASNYTASAIHNVLVVKNSILQDAATTAKIVKFLKVVSQTWLYCRDNEATCLNAFPYYGPMESRLMRKTLQLVFPSPSGLGVLPTASWTTLETELISTNLITSRSSYTSKINNTWILQALTSVAGASQATAAYAPGSVNLCAPYGSATPLRVCAGVEHTLCSAGYEPDASNPPCKSCGPGHFSANQLTIGKQSRMNSCVQCPAGTFTTSSGTTQCTYCGKGKFRSNSAADYTVAQQYNASNVNILSDLVSGIKCASCAGGKVASSEGMTVCALCETGRFAASKGGTKCHSCADGTYASGHGATQCSACPDTSKTIGEGASFEYECACSSGEYRAAATQVCIPCPFGFSCPQGSDETVLNSFASGYVSGEYPHLLKGYWSSLTNPLSVFLCKDEISCPGGPPDTCGSHMGDQACSLCSPGYFRQGEKCESCTNTDETWFNYPTLPIIFGIFMALILYAWFWDEVDKWANVMNELWALAFLVVVHYQIIGLIVGASVQWPSNIKGTLYAWEYFVDIPDMLRLSCLNNGDFRLFKDSYTIKVTAQFFMLACFVVIYVTGWLLAALGAVMRKGSKKNCLDDMFKCLNMKRLTGTVPPHRAVEPSVLFNTYMAVFFAFFISFAFISLQLFMCYEHPNGKITLRFSPDVYCDSTAWMGLLAEGLLMLVPCCGIAVAGMIYAVVVAPTQFHSKGFRARWKFLLIKWRPDVWWFGVVVVIRSLLLCLTHIFSQEGQRQLLWQLAIMISYGALVAVYRPWRYWSANVLDMEICGTLVIFLAFCMTFVTRIAWLDDAVAHFGNFVIFVPAGIYVFTVLWILIRLAMKPQMEKYIRTTSDNMQIALAKYSGLDKKAAEAFVDKLVEQDIETLRRAQFMLSVQLLNDPGNSRTFRWMVKMSTVDRFPQAGVNPPDDDPNMFDPGDLTTDGQCEQSKWGQSPPNRMAPIPASRGGTGELTPSEKGGTPKSTAANSGITPPTDMKSPPPPKI